MAARAKGEIVTQRGRRLALAALAAAGCKVAKGPAEVVAILTELKLRDS